MSRSTVVIDTSQLQRWGGMLRHEILDVARRVEPAVGDEAAQIESEASAQVPVLTGTLAGTIRTTGTGPRRRVVAGGARAIHAPFQEFGTTRHGPQPYLITQARGETHDRFEDRVDKAVGKGQIYR